MSFKTWISEVLTAADLNGNFALCVRTDSAKTVTVGHTYTASQTFTGGLTSGAGMTSSSATAGIGYATGAGGTVTQATDKSTTVVLNKVCGQITLNAANLAAGTIVSFALTNSAIAAGDLIVLNHVGGGTPGSYTLNGRAGAGGANIEVRNNTAGGLAEAIVIGFAVIKGVTA